MQKLKGITLITQASSSESVAELVLLTYSQVFVFAWFEQKYASWRWLTLMVWKAYANGVELRGKTLESELVLVKLSQNGLD
jgi:hypothetical protein